ncbi:hypothetical protein [Aureimonas sp. AU20]|uniref:hypothetical protein n=1 Tax=Aureimonas sp. AU20 TaxID=1349819 RepID=UPI00072138C9|nr:hypothetical protein [Aureimonas sp. AU20]ALN72220.1 hypothetical protein M673_05800 [Aureimonas sp. AU20]
MPLPNRVTPFGEIVADPARGLFMGNRGILHDENRRLGTSRWRHPHWIICRLDYGTTGRALMAPGAYTELFFLDEATALAAGHRACALCCPEAFRRFLACWPLDAKPGAKAVDAALHAARVTRDRRQVTYEAPLDSLPDGAMVEADGAAWLVWRGRRHRWSPAGYLDAEPLCARSVNVLTPAPTVDVLRAGYEPVLHTSLAA